MKAGIIILLVLVGLVLILFELLTPSFGVLSALALAALVGAVWVAFTVSGVLGVVLIVVLLFAVPAYLGLLIRFLPRTRWGRGLFLPPVPDPTASGVPTAAKYAALVGRTGTAETLLRPGGAVRIDGQRVVALAESGVIEKGAAVKVVRADGPNVIVRRLAQPGEGGASPSSRGGV